MWTGLELGYRLRWTRKLQQNHTGDTKSDINRENQVSTSSEGGDRETEQEKKQLSCLVAKSKRLGYFISFKLILLKFVHHKNLFKKKRFIVVVYLFFIFL